MAIPAERVSRTSENALMRYFRRYGWTGGLGGAIIAGAILAAWNLPANLS